MAWLRIDDGFAQHPKVLRLTPKDRWIWVEILCYCARYRTDGIVPDSISEVVRGASPAYLNRCFELHLLDLSDGEYHIHDWLDYNGKDAKILVKERVRKHRERNADVTPENDAEALQERYSRAGARARPRPVPSPTKTSPSFHPELQNAGRTEGRNEIDQQRLNPAAILAAAAGDDLPL